MSLKPPLRVVMRMTAIDSSVIAEVGYDPDTGTLEVHFHNGREYRYFLVPQSKYDALMKADSTGKYFNRRIRDRYRSTQIA